MPLTYAGVPVGTLVVAPRDGDEALSPADERLLAEVARPLGVLAHAAALQDRLEQARLRLVVEAALYAIALEAPTNVALAPSPLVGAVAGKLVAGLCFYLPTILSYELLRRRRESDRREVR